PSWPSQAAAMNAVNKPTRTAPQALIVHTGSIDQPSPGRDVRSPSPKKLEHPAWSEARPAEWICFAFPTRLDQRRSFVGDACGQRSAVAVGTSRSRRALLTHRAPPSGQTSCDERFSYARRPTRSHYSDRRGISAQCPNRGRLTAVPLG